MNENTNTLINKLIVRTKDQLLRWSKYNSSIIPLKDTKRDLFNTSKYLDNSHALVNDACYYSNHFDTFFFLMVYKDYLNNSIIKLHVQTADSEYSKIYASTAEDDAQIISELKRLYNLVDSYDDPIEENIRIFINL